MPAEETTHEMQTKLKGDISTGIYNIDNLIVPQVFYKITSNESKLVKEEMKVQGRKIPLKVIRETLLKDQKNFMRMQTDEELLNLTEEEIKNYLKGINELDEKDEQTLTKDTLLRKMKAQQRTRHMMMWHDSSSLSNHSHILMMVSVMYDPAVFLTDRELL